MKCIDCGKEIEQGYMCDVEYEKEVDNKTLAEMIHCPLCFEKLGCVENHPEDCATLIVSEGDDAGGIEI